ncbi:hypothetical protein [Nocardia seriolae]|uniref:hypothetical protein n=1 Tax=Nocardia seriolae TaxID=37332 RepID=UPI000ADD6669|nr:hypothetical protein [Nocardia seriolae]BEK86966.1 hypothetical protein NSERKGN1266_29170 [Nocardia seriolae]
MTTTHPRPGHRGPGHSEENLGEFAEELRLLAEAVLERVEPVLRRTASDGRTEWSSCSWCPVCAAAAIVRGEHHDVVAAVAEHGTAIVTVLREALAGVPVDPVIPPELDPDSPEYQAWHHFSQTSGTDSGATDLPFADAYATARGEDGSATGEGEPAWAGDQSARPGHPHGPGANLAAVFARFLAGAQGRSAARNQDAAARNQAGANDFGAPETTGDPLGHGPGAARRPGADRADAVPHSAYGGTAAGSGSADPRTSGVGDARGDGGPFGPPVARPADAGGAAAGSVPAPGAAPTAGSSGAARESGSARGAAQPGRRPKRGKYVPIEVTIKA